MRPGEMLRDAILNHVQYTLVRPASDLKPIDYLKPLSLAIRRRISTAACPISYFG